MSEDDAKADRLARPAVAAGWLALFTALPAWDVLLGRGVYWAHDLRHHYHPWRHWAAERWARGEVPLWAADVGAGAPLMADGQVGALYPVNILLGLALPSHVALSVGLLLHAWWAAMGGWFLARSLGRSGAASLLAGLLIGGGGFMVGHLTYAGMHAVAAWAPWAFAFALRLGRGEAARWAAPFGVAVACCLLAGHVQLAAISLLGALLVFLAGRPGPRDLAWAGGGAALGLGAASAQLAASLELARLSARGGGVDAAFARVGALPPQELLNLAFPRLWGWERPADIALSYMHKGPLYYGTGEAHWEGLIYLGLPALLLAGLALRERAARGWWALVGAALALMLATPAWDLLRLLPGFAYFRFPARFGLWLGVALAVLAAQGLDRLTAEAPETSNSSRSRKTRRLALGAFGLVVGGGLAARLALLAVEPMARGALMGALGARPGGPERVEAILSGLAWSGTWGLVLPGLSLLALAALVGKRAARTGILLLVALDLTVTLWGYNPRFDPALAAEPPWTAEHAAQPGLDRASAVDRVQPVALDRALISSSLGLVWGTRDVILTSPLRLPRHEALLAAAGLDVGLDHGPAKAATLMERLDLASMLNVRRVLTVHRMAHPRLAELAVGEDGVRVYENLDAMPRASFVPCAVAVDGPEAALERLLEEGPRQSVFVEDHEPAACKPRAPGRARVRLYEDEKALIAVDAPQGGYLLLSDLHYPGWEVEVDGDPAELLRANVSLRAVRLPAGAEQVRFVYRPAWAGLLPVSALSGVLLLLGLGLARPR